MSKQTRILVIRSLNAEFVFARKPFPSGEKGLTIKDGVVIPGDTELGMLVASKGAAAKVGDRAKITNVQVKDRSIILEINGGPRKKTKWYERIQISGAGGAASVPDSNDPNARGSYVELVFDKFVPEMTGDQVRALLAPVLDFHAKSAAEAYIETVPPKVKQAIKNHQVLVGMNREMVTYAKGRPDKKIRERDGSTEYEEWLYGQPPKDVEFVRFVGDQVVRLEIMKVNGEKVIRTEREVEVSDSGMSSLAKKEEEQPKKPAVRPTLRRPGEAPDEDAPQKPATKDPSQVPPLNPPQPPMNEPPK